MNGQAGNWQWDKKTKKKAIRTAIELVIIALIVLLIVRAVKTTNTYIPYQEDFLEATEDNGFIAISYFAVDKFGTDTMISAKQLDEHIRVLKESGYVTIRQKDIEDYYWKGKLLPEKSLFLFFEDGRRDSAIFAQRSLEKYNYVATMLSYAENLDKKGMRMLSGNDLKNLKKSTFWELGSNGYRLSYINVFDRYGDYLGEMTTDEYIKMTPYLQKDYNHYLMDFIRDEDLIPLESMEQMEERVAWDYKQLQEIYNKSLGETPQLYTLMHSNTNQFGTDDLLSKQNEKWMTEVFSMNFNRDGYSFNSLDENDNIYDMTRLSPQAHWSTNHLLMRLWVDTGADMAWQIGDKTQAAFWETKAGIAEYDEEKLVLTSLPKKEGKLSLLEAETADVYFEAQLTGNKFGAQRVNLRESADGDSYIQVEIMNNFLNIYEKSGDDLEELFTLDLDVHDGIVKQTVGEHHQEALETGVDVKKKQSYKSSDSKKISRELNIEAQDDHTDDEIFVPEIRMSQPASRKLGIDLTGDRLVVRIDEAVAADVTVSCNGAGTVSLVAQYGGTSEDERDYDDDVYDAVFEKLVITDGEENILFDNQLRGFGKVKQTVGNWFERAAYWFAHVV